MQFVRAEVEEVSTAISEVLLCESVLICSLWYYVGEISSLRLPASLVAAAILEAGGRRKSLCTSIW